MIVCFSFIHQSNACIHLLCKAVHHTDTTKKIIISRVQRIKLFLLFFFFCGNSKNNLSLLDSFKYKAGFYYNIYCVRCDTNINVSSFRVQKLNLVMEKLKNSFKVTKKKKNWFMFWIFFGKDKLTTDFGWCVYTLNLNDNKKRVES